MQICMPLNSFPSSLSGEAGRGRGRGRGEGRGRGLGGSTIAKGSIRIWSGESSSTRGRQVSHANNSLGKGVVMRRSKKRHLPLLGLVKGYLITWPASHSTFIRIISRWCHCSAQNNWINFLWEYKDSDSGWWGSSSLFPTSPGRSWQLLTHRFGRTPNCRDSRIKLLFSNTFPMRDNWVIP